ncbi:MAG: uracil-DNA glycosylase [Candidatus Melainabacteria bacterium]|nr:uracil-DNA glycosylase [Candidatus Melainabacteria bacterium]MBI3308165.1 uracil-DNA glycosylase [Candidatus Melainabacteria bacterium]
MQDLKKLQNKITQCKRCPRLVSYLRDINKKYPTYWCKPVPSFGDHLAQILIVGLAPGRFGSNRTARMFTGDASGKFLYDTLHQVGLCNQPDAKDINDGLRLKNCYITAVGRCAPPQNKPTPQELKNCFPYFVNELVLLKRVKIIVALGKIAFDSYLKWLLNSDVRGLSGIRKKDFKFSHGALYNHDFMPHILIASYHPSRQNTQTGKLTKKMFKEIFLKAQMYIV